jgi:hypothetical protein
MMRMRRDGCLGARTKTPQPGAGFKVDAEMNAQAGRVTDASRIAGHGLHGEIGKATIRQDNKRAVDFVRPFQDGRFTPDVLDLSSRRWGHEMAYGGERPQGGAEPEEVFACVRSVQARIGAKGMIRRPHDRRTLRVRHTRSPPHACLVMVLQGRHASGVPAFAGGLPPPAGRKGAGAPWLWHVDDNPQSDRFARACDLLSLAPGSARRHEGPEQGRPMTPPFWLALVVLVLVLTGRRAGADEALILFNVGAWLQIGTLAPPGCVSRRDAAAPVRRTGGSARAPAPARSATVWTPAP